jgi:tetratricopeptide (TPR) repeat protein
VQHHSNEGALLLTTHPNKALEHVEQMLAIASDGERDFGSILHARVDRAMALFLMRRYDEADAEARGAERFASANGVPAQAARARNILGCCHWVRGDLKQACREFERAILDAERSLSERFLWRMRANMAGAALEIGRVTEAAAHARSAAWRILMPRRGQWPQGQGALTRRWYHALILCGAVLQQAGDGDALREVVNEIPLPDFVTAVARAAAGEVFSAVGDVSTSIHAGRIMITG